MTETIEVKGFEFDRWSDGDWTLSVGGGDHMATLEPSDVAALERFCKRFRETM